jgi:UDP-glucose 4-epimerase
MKNKRVVITGGAGFIGSNIADELSVDNEVIIIDDLSTGRIENIQGLLDKGNVTFIQGSVTDLPLLQHAFKKVDFIFHQAAMASVSRSIEDPLAANEANITGTLNVLIAARDNHVRKVVCASSCALYGDSPVLPKKEDMLPEPQSPYAVTKLASEQYCQVFGSVYGLPAVCLRYFNVYGPRQDPRSDYAAVIPKFITHALHNRPLIIFGDGEQTRDFIFIKDVVRANILAAEAQIQGIYNVGSGESISVNMLAATIEDIVGRKLEIVHREPRSGEVRHSRADISKASTFGYEPKYNLNAGLTETITWFSHL